MAITQHFYNGTIRKITVALGTLFNNIEIHRTTEDNTKVVKVPITYASKEKFYLLLKQNPNLIKAENIILPRLGFILTDLAYDFERKQSSIGKFAAVTNDQNSYMKKMFLPVPYDIHYQLSIYSRNVDDGLQILEQIIAFWKPSFNITINELDSMGVVRDIPIILDSISYDDTSEGSVQDNFRLVRWDLDFTVKANFYGPTKDQPVIKKIYVDYHTSFDGEYQDKIDERYYGYVDPQEAGQDDEWVYTEEVISSHDSTNTEILPPEEDIESRGE